MRKESSASNATFRTALLSVLFFEFISAASSTIISRFKAEGRLKTIIRQEKN